MTLGMKPDPHDIGEVRAWLEKSRTGEMSRHAAKVQFGYSGRVAKSEAGSDGLFRVLSCPPASCILRIDTNKSRLILVNTTGIRFTKPR